MVLSRRHGILRIHILQRRNSYVDSTRDTAVSVSESTFLRDNMVCHLDTVTYVSAEHGEKETVVEVCEPYVAPEPKDCTQSSQEREPESQVFISPEFGNAIVALV